MITEMVTVECHHANMKETSEWLNKLARYFNEHDLGHVVQVMHHISGPRNQFHILINFASMAEHEQKRQMRIADGGLTPIWEERNALVINSTHHFLETTIFFER
jgi:hypothetical protein